MSWHADDGDLREYAHGTLAAPRLWSVETHLAACADCRAALSAHVPPAEISAGWARLDAALDAPRPGPVESLLVRLGVADHTARLLAATPVLRRSWLGAVVLTLLLAVGVGVAASPLLLLATAPLLPLAGVAVSFGPALDPTYETAVVAPMHTFRLLMVRTVAVLATTTALSALASLALPSFGLAALGWLLPALALTSTGVALTARLGPVLAPVLVGTGWTALVVLSRLLASG
ncbi:Putative zinc-finger, partial [Streptomyces sp. cf124]|uniref:zf-HC2 domain-containing protein n=2 Tax=Streptomyces TaxID=1883 RepID=UPI0008E2EC4F